MITFGLSKIWGCVLVEKIVLLIYSRWYSTSFKIHYVKENNSPTCNMVRVLVNWMDTPYLFFAKDFLPFGRLIWYGEDQVCSTWSTCHVGCKLNTDDGGERWTSPCPPRSYHWRFGHAPLSSAHPLACPYFPFPSNLISSK